MSFFQNSTSNQADKDIEIPDPPTDSISCMSFSGTADFLAAGSWDNNVCTELHLWFIHDVGLNVLYRYEFMKSTTKANPKAKLCTHIKALCFQYAGIRYVQLLELQVLCPNLLYRRETRSFQEELIMRVDYTI